MSFPGFSFGSSKSSSQSQSDALQFGVNGSSSFGVNGSSSVSDSLGRSSADQRVAFEDLFAQLYGGASSAAAGIDTGAIGGAAKQLFSGGLSFLQTLQANPGAEALAARAGDTTARDAQLDVLKTGLGDLFNEQLMPGVTSLGVSTGTLGGSRDAVARAQAAKAVAGQYATGAAQILASDQAGRDAAAGKLGDLTVAGAGTGLSALDSIYGLAQGGELAGLSPYQALAQILGGPTVLGSSQSTDVAHALASSFGEQGSQSYGFDFGTSSSSSSSKSKAFQFGIGGV